MSSLSLRKVFVALLISAIAPCALAHGHWRGGSQFGFYFGDPFFYGPRYYYPPYYYSPPPIVVQEQPPVYIERSATKNVWYYCRQPAGYYPYVAQCNQQWIPVDPSSVPPPAPSVGAPR